jgi:LysR family hydrogen peroxide-inducible transcriptional activator
VAGGAGVTLLPELAVSTEAQRAGLITRPFADPAPCRTVALVWRRRSPITGALGRLAATLRDAYPPSPSPSPSPRRRRQARR